MSEKIITTIVIILFFGVLACFAETTVEKATDPKFAPLYIIDKNPMTEAQVDTRITQLNTSKSRVDNEIAKWEKIKIDIQKLK